MSAKHEKPSTSDQFVEATYQAARGVFVGEQVKKPAMTQQVRTVFTSATGGSLELRYAPHKPRVTDVSTSS